ncbi:hypothetical protein BLOT_005206 [Blomia tropicalis]|nr:hypothetical protein BLOT_005206 [Blomia tropicalis]
MTLCLAGAGSSLLSAAAETSVDGASSAGVSLDSWVFGSESIASDSTGVLSGCSAGCGASGIC